MTNRNTELDRPRKQGVSLWSPTNGIGAHQLKMDLSEAGFIFDFELVIISRSQEVRNFGWPKMVSGSMTRLIN